MGVVGATIVQELRGVLCLALEDRPPPKQGITVSWSCGKIRPIFKYPGERHRGEFVQNG
jgi:hypothetical protein